MSFNANAIVLTGSDQILFQAPAGTEGAMHGLVFNNSGPEVAFLTLKFLDASSAITQIVLQDFLIPADSQFTWPKPIDLASGDAVIASGNGLVALQSSYIQTAVPAAVGFVGRGAWTSIALYNANDVVSYNNNSYLANNANTNSAPPSVNWTLLAAQGAAGTITNTVRTPTAISPLTGGLPVNPVGPLEASEYAPLYSVNERLYRTFQVTTPADTTFATPVFSLNVDADTTLIDPALTEDTNFIWRCRDVSEEGINSDWMTTQAFLTKDYSVNTPTVTVEGSPSSVNQQPLLTLSAYTTSPDQTATYLSTDWEVRRVSDNVLVFSSYGDTINVSSITIPPGVLVTSTAYAFRARYNSTIYGSSAYGSTTATTLATFVQQLFPALPFIGNTVVNIPVAYPQKKIFAIDETRSIQVYQRFNRNSSLGTTGQRWYLAVVTNTVNGPVTDPTKHLILPDTVAIANAHAPQIVMRSTTVGYMVWGNVAQTQVIFADITVSGDTITLGTQTVIDNTSTPGSNLQPTITTIRDGWYMIVFNFYSGTNNFTKVFGVEVVDGLPVVGTGVLETQYSGMIYDTASIGSDKVVVVANGLTAPLIYTFTKNPVTLAFTFTRTVATTFPTSVGSFANNFAVTAIAPGTVMLVGPNASRTVAVVIKNLAGAGGTQTYSPAFLFSTALASAVGDVTALSSSTVFYTRPDSVSLLTYDAVTDTIVESSRVVVPVAAEMPNIRALQAPNIATPNATAAHLYAGWASSTDAYTTTSITIYNGTLVLSPVAYVLGFASAPTSLNSQTITTLSATRAVVMTREFDEASTTFSSTVLSLFDITGQTPILLSRLNVSGGALATSTSVPFVVTALSDTKILLVYGNSTNTGVLALVTVSGNTMTLNQSIAYPVMSSISADIARLTSASAILTFVNATIAAPPVAQVVTLSGDGLSMVVGAGATVGVSNTQLTRVAALSATRAVVYYNTMVSLLDLTGGAITVLQQEVVTLPNAGLPARIVPLSATTALLNRTSTTNVNLALITMSGNTVSVGAASTSITVVSGAEMSIAPTTSTSGVLFSSQAANLSIYTFSISGTTVTTTLVNSAITSSGANTSGAGIVSAIPPYTGVPITSGNAVLIYRDTRTVEGSTNFYKIQKYQRA
jgi:hypothetical protein